MDIPDFVKSQITVANFLYFLCLLCLVLHVYGKRKAALITLIFTFLVFVSASTPFLPDHLIIRLESRVQPLNNIPESLKEEQVLIHVLGGGYSLSGELPANVQLALPTLGRLTEGIRLHRLLPQSILVTSGYSSLGLKSQASVMRDAAISLGVDSARIASLHTPSNTWEEAEALKQRFGKHRKVIVVSDAVHLPRALRFFDAQGLDAIGSASNYLVHPNAPRQPWRWLPSVRNVEKSNIILREYLGTAKGFILN